MTDIVQIAEKFARADLNLWPPISALEVSEFERSAHVSLPPDFVLFLTHVCNGGVYPSCFLQGLGSWSSCHWIDNPLPDISLNTTFIGTPESQSHGENWIDAAGVADWESRFDNNEWDPMYGTIAVAEIGCGLFYNLVVCGPFAGRVFAYGDHVNNPPQFLEHPSFARWIESSIDSYLDGDVVYFLDRSRLTQRLREG